MTDLTEQWKKGKLPDGMYYMENTSGIIGMVGHSKAFPCYNVKQILASVPSYEKWEKFRNALADNQIENSSLLIENTQLKELLKKCKGLFNRSTVDGAEPNNGELIMILTKIDEALK